MRTLVIAVVALGVALVSPPADAKPKWKTLAEGVAHANALQAKGKTKQAIKTWQAVAKLYKVRNIAAGSMEAEAAAEALFRLADSRFAAYAKLRFGPKHHLKKAKALLNKKIKAIKELEQGYRAVIELDTRWTICAVQRMGDTYREFADTLLKSPRPGNLSDEEYDAYKTTIEDQAVRFEDRAVRLYEQAIKGAKAMKLPDDPCAKRAEKWVQHYRPAAAPKPKPAAPPKTPSKGGPTP